MTGLLLLILAALWLVAAVFITRFVARKVPSPGWRPAVATIVFFALVVGPLADDIIGGRQFKALCQEKTPINVDRSRAVNKTVYLLDERPYRPSGLLVPVTEQPWRYADVDTKEILVSFSTLEAKGGWLIRALGISETDSPITFERFCGPEDRSSVFQSLNIQQIQRKDLRRAEPK